MSTNTYIDPVFTTELREWIQNDTEPYIPNESEVPPWNKGFSMNVGEENPFYGKKHSPETRKKMREAAANRPAHTEQQKILIGEANSKRVWSEEAKKKISVVHKGKTISEEHKRKISEYWAKRSIQKVS
jgi:hypothetical protein